MLRELFTGIERGEFPSEDGVIRVAPPPDPASAAVVGFSGLVVIAADIPPDWVEARVPAGDLSEPLNPPFLGALCDRLGRRVNCIDAVLYASAADGPPPIELSGPVVAGGSAPPAESTDRTIVGHSRVQRASRYRTEVRAYGTTGGLVVIGRGLAGRLEAAFEVEPEHRGKGLGRRLAEAARHLAAAAGARGIWAQVAPGNAASLRAVLAAGYRPVGSEALLVPAAARAPGG